MPPEPQSVVVVPLDLLERMVREITRLADIVDEYHRDVLPELKRLRGIEEAREAAREQALAEKGEGLAMWQKLIFSRLAVGVASGLLALAATYLLGSNGIAPQGVKDGLSPVEEVADGP